MNVFHRLSLLLVIFSVQTKAYEVEESIAAWGVAEQSSTYAPSWPASNALDGNNATCSHTQSQNNPWWMLDLLDSYSVTQVSVTNRPDCCETRINGAEIYIGNDPSSAFNNPVCSVIASIPAGQTYSYTCASVMDGRYVFVAIPATNRILTLCEVKVKAIFQANLATGKYVTQSTTFGSWIAQQAIDFNPGFTRPQSACSCTTSQTNPWWSVDLGFIYQVSRVVVTNRLDCCPERINGAEIRIGNSLENNGNDNPICAVISSIPAGVSSTFACNNMEGRYVNLIIPGDSRFLTLCEVEVYGEGPCLKQTHVRLKLQSSLGLTDTTLREQILTELGSALAQTGLSDVTLSWIAPPTQEVMRKSSAPAQCPRSKR